MQLGIEKSKLTLGNVDHGAGRLGVRGRARVVARVGVRYVSYCQLARDGSIRAAVPLVVRLVNVRVIHQVTVDLGDYLHSRPGPRSRTAAVFGDAAAAPADGSVTRRLGSHRASIGRRVVINHPVVVIPEDELRFLRNLCGYTRAARLLNLPLSIPHHRKVSITFRMMQVNWMALPLSTWYSLPPTIDVDGTTTLTL